MHVSPKSRKPAVGAIAARRSSSATTTGRSELVSHRSIRKLSIASFINYMDAKVGAIDDVAEYVDAT